MEGRYVQPSLEGQGGGDDRQVMQKKDESRESEQKKAGVRRATKNLRYIVNGELCRYVEKVPCHTGGLKIHLGGTSCTQNEQHWEIEPDFWQTGVPKRSPQ